MDKKSFEVMLRLYLDPDFKDGEITKEYLKSSGIDAEAFKQNCLLKLANVDSGSSTGDSMDNLNCDRCVPNS